LITYATSIY